MEPKSLRSHKGPEAKIQEAIIRELRYREWFVKETHGNMYQMGFPDLYCRHSMYGERWVEVKNPTKYCFTPAQLKDFPMFTAHGAGIWILTSADEQEIKKLFGPPNWKEFLLKLQLRS